MNSIDSVDSNIRTSQITRPKYVMCNNCKTKTIPEKVVIDLLDDSSYYLLRGGDNFSVCAICSHINRFRVKDDGTIHRYDIIPDRQKNNGRKSKDICLAFLLIIVAAVLCTGLVLIILWKTGRF